MKNSVGFTLLLLGLAGVARSSVPPGDMYVLAPPTLNDIMTSLGPDARGLQIHSDNLPDIFTLTASRIDEDPKKFIVEQPYTAGRWIGGKAVIEYARDLSYTMVSIYDKAGKRQRIYSVTSKSSYKALTREMFPEDAARMPSKRTVETPETPGEDAVEPVAETVPAVDPELAQVAPISKSEPVAKSAARIRSPAKTSEAAPGVKTKRVHADGFEWDDQSSSYVPAKEATKNSVVTPVASARTVSEAPRETTRQNVSKGRSRQSAQSATASVPVTSASRAAVVSVPEPVASVPVSAPASNKPIETITGQVVDSEVPSEDELLGIAPVSKEKPKATPSVAGSNSVPAARPAARSTTATVTVPVVTVPVPATPSIKPVETMTGQVVDSEVPSEEELLGSVPAPKEKPKSASAVPIPVVASVPRPVSPTVPVPAVVREATPSRARPTEDRSVKAVPEEKKFVWDDESASYVPESEAKAKAKNVRNPVERVPSESHAVPVSEPVSPPAKPSKKKLEEARSAAVSVPVTIPEAVEEEVPAPAGPATSESDAWVPKATPKPVPVPEVPVVKEPVKVVSVPKPAAPPTIDELLKVAAQSNKYVPNESETWVPKTKEVDARTSEVDVNAEIARLRAKKSAEKPPVQEKIRRDINNPEEGVLPINAFEKFSGPRYGRHREYERRVYWGKRPQASISDYDFYVDEVDRKKEIHNVYYYKKDKVPKLVAQERFEDVKFLSNYDVDVSKHSKGKVTRY